MMTTKLSRRIKHKDMIGQPGEGWKRAQKKGDKRERNKAMSKETRQRNNTMTRDSRQEITINTSMPRDSRKEITSNTIH